MKRCYVSRIIFLGTLFLATPPRVDASLPEQLCVRDLARATTRLHFAYHRSLSDCIKFRHYGNCAPLNRFVDRAENKLVRALAPGSNCADALTQGTLLTDLFPSTCPASWRPCGTWLSDIESLEDISSCINCSQYGLYQKLLGDLRLPVGAPENLNESKCIRSAVSLFTKTVRAGIKQALKCGKGKVRPVDCIIDSAEDTPFAKAHDRISIKLQKCRDSNGEAGRVSGDVTKMCPQAIVDPADLAQCVSAVSKCAACTTLEPVYDSGQNCADFSGYSSCNLQFDEELGRAPRGTYFVTGQADNTLTAYEPPGWWPFAGQPIATIATGAEPIASVVVNRSNRVVVANRASNSVVYVNASSVGYAQNTLEDSTFAVGTEPTALAVHEDRMIVYVANSGDDTVTFLDASDGSYLFDSIVSSSFSTGSAPSALAVDEEGDVLFVANRDDNTFTMLDALTGRPKFGDLAGSTFLTGDEPSGIAFDPHSSELAVANAGDGTVAFFDGTTGLPLLGSLTGSSVFVASGVRTVSFQPRGLQGPTFSNPEAGIQPVFALSNTASVIAALDSSTLTGGSIVEFSVGVNEPSGIAFSVVRPPTIISSQYQYDMGLVQIPSKTDDVVWTGPAATPRRRLGLSGVETSTIGLSVAPHTLAFNENAGLVYAGTNDGRVVTHRISDGVVVNDVAVGDPDAWVEVHYNEPGDRVFAADSNYAYGNYGYNSVVILDGMGAYRGGSLTTATVCGDCSITNVGTFSKTANIAYVEETDSVVFLDGTSGAYLYGSYATSSFPVDPGELIQSSAVNDELGVYYAGTTGQRVVYLDAVTGQYLHGDHSGSTVDLATTPENLVASESTNALVAIGPGGSNSIQILYILEAASPVRRFASNGTNYDHRVGRVLNRGWYTSYALNDSLGYFAIINNFRWLDRSQLDVLDLATGTVVYSTIPEDPYGVEPNPAVVSSDESNGIFYVSVYEWDANWWRRSVGTASSIVYRNALDGTYLNGDLESSRIVFGSYNTSVPLAAYGKLFVQRTADQSVPIHGYFLLDLDSAALPDTARFSDYALATGASPSSVAVVTD